MGFKLKKFSKVSASLEPGEQFVAGAFAMAPGGVKRQALATGAFGALGAVVAAKRTNASGSFTLPNQFLVGLTDRRLLFFKPGGLTGKASELIGSVARSEIAAAGFTESAMMSRPVRIDLRNGEHVAMETQKGPARKWMEELLGHLGAPPIA